MTWSETHRRQQILTEVERTIERQGGGPLPWCEAYADAFGDRDSLLIALTARWRTRLQAQLDPELSTELLVRTRLDLERRHGALLRLLRGPLQPRPA